MRTLNMNDNVKVKLTQTGLKELKRQHEELRTKVPSIGEFKAPPVDEEGYSEFQCWVLFSALGNLMVLGGEPPFEIDVLVVK